MRSGKDLPNNGGGKAKILAPISPSSIAQRASQAVSSILNKDHREVRESCRRNDRLWSQELEGGVAGVRRNATSFRRRALAERSDHAIVESLDAILLLLADPRLT